MRPILGMFGERCSFLTSLQTMWIGNFFGQALVTFLIGDAVRIWWIMRLGIGLRVAASAILIDPAIGFIALMVEEGHGVDDIAQAEANEHQS